MALRGSVPIPNQFTIPGHPVNRPDPENRKSREQRLRDKKKSDRIRMDGDTFKAHHGHRKGEDDRLPPYTGNRP